jgi:hypothetical protein
MGWSLFAAKIAKSLQGARAGRAVRAVFPGACRRVSLSRAVLSVFGILRVYRILVCIFRIIRFVDGNAVLRGGRETAKIIVFRTTIFIIFGVCKKHETYPNIP